MDPGFRRDDLYDYINSRKVNYQVEKLNYFLSEVPIGDSSSSTKPSV